MKISSSAQLLLDTIVRHYSEDFRGLRTAAQTKKEAKKVLADADFKELQTAGLLELIEENGCIRIKLA